MSSNLFFAYKNIVLGIVFLIGSKGWMSEGQNPYPAAKAVLHWLLLVVFLSNWYSGVKGGVKIMSSVSHAYLIIYVYEWKRFEYLKSLLL